MPGRSLYHMQEVLLSAEQCIKAEQYHLCVFSSWLFSPLFLKTYRIIVKGNLRNWVQICLGKGGSRGTGVVCIHISFDIVKKICHVKYNIFCWVEKKWQARFHGLISLLATATLTPHDPLNVQWQATELTEKWETVAWSKCCDMRNNRNHDTTSHLWNTYDVPAIVSIFMH